MSIHPVHKNLTDTNQSSWQLAYIQLAGIISLPSLASSILLLQKYSFFSALMTLFVGNIMLWIIRFGLIKISSNHRKSTLDLAYDCFGKWGAHIIAIALLADTLAWFFIHTSVASDVIVFLFDFKYFSGTNHFIQLSIVVGVLSTLLCMEGMKSLRILALLSFPILLITFLGMLIFSSSPQLPEKIASESGISLSGIGLVLGFSLGFSVDLPTFFRHRQSWKDSKNALAIFQISSLVIGIGGLFLAQFIHINLETGDYEIGILNTFQRCLLSIFVLTSAVYANVYNVYSSSVGWELVAPAALVGRKEYLILGLTLTIFFISCFKILSLHKFLDIVDSSMINLCMVLFWFFLTFLALRRSPSVQDKGLYFIAWLLSSSLNIFQIFYYGFISSYMLLCSFLIVLAIAFFKLLINVSKKNFLDF